MVFADDGKLWREKFHGVHGRVQQLEREKSELAGEMEDLETKNDSLRAEIDTREDAITQLNTRIDELSAVESRVDELKQERDTLAERADLADKLDVLMDYPELLTRKVTEEVETEDGEVVEESHNPYLDLVKSSNLEGDALRSQIDRLARTLGEEPASKSEPEADKDMSGASPEPGQPMEETPEMHRAKAEELRKQAYNADNRTELMEQMTEHYQRARELEEEMQ
jgi:predicted nuclease with TOPRIM domain